MEAKTQIIISEKQEKHHVIGEHFHVLAVDDSVIERKMLEKLLTVSSYHVTCVESGDKALEYLGLVNCRHRQPVIGDGHVDEQVHHVDDDHDDVVDDEDDDSMICPLQLTDDVHHHQQEGQGTRVNLIMTDYSMPGMSGYDLLKRVKESSWKDVPVVVMSSENVPSRIHMCLEEGAEEFLLKPVRLSDLKKLQPRIFKTTPSSSATNDNNNKFFKDEITIVGDDEDYVSNSKEEDEKKEINFKNIEMDQFAKISKLDQLVM
ncbi:hypothetical protein BVRB_1g007420 [Beta vulgaris subsp. vulgaris]|uniref:two-component response regulator ORR9 n=1 Tax=Beta vulgaris subsp. vulgaris TaxID=3555 RepID=UPI0005401C4E|nr:two-component response regulator ORR9 [Beta vulgaris subsp. vulgaris]KMT19685.1 hypothetical protein BVRB_1g007420 [Beta vulgaris subsp. vulgaris]